jgi:thioredoxin-like negative regulator of GroEL
MLYKVDADDNPGLLRTKQIQSIPYLELYKDGKLIWQHAGLISEEELREAAGF